MGNIYGMDIKIGPDLKPVLIEINGVDSGTDCFRYEEGSSYYRKFSKVVSHYAEGKPVFVKSRHIDMPDDVQKLVKVQELQDERARYNEYYRQMSKIFNGDMEFDYSWVDDLYDFHIGKIENPYFDSEDSSYSFAARQEDVPLFLYKKATFNPKYVTFELTDGRKMRMNYDDIGFVRPASEEFSSIPAEAGHVVMNSEFIEAVLSSKPLTKFVGVFHEPFSELFMPHENYGLGICPAESVINFIETVSGNKIVKKYSRSYCGTGVFVLPKHEAIDKLRKTSSGGPRHDSNYFAAIMRMIRTHEAFDYLTMYEEFANSLPIENPRTGRFHDGCARVIVYSPDDGLSSPVVLGSQWRLAPSPIDSGSLNDMYRANLSRGATAVPIEEPCLSIAENFARQATREFEFSIMLLKNEQRKASREVRVNPEESKRVKEQELLSTTFWLYNLNAAGRLPSRGRDLGEVNKLFDKINAAREVLTVNTFSN